jgi:hypothetical protein
VLSRVFVLDPAVRERPPHVHDAGFAVNVVLFEPGQLRRSKTGRCRENDHQPIHRAKKL